MDIDRVDPKVGTRKLSLGLKRSMIHEMKRRFLTTYEASRKFKLSMGYLRLLIGKGILKAESVKVTSKRVIWLIDEASLKAFLKTPRTPGPKPKSKPKKRS